MSGSIAGATISFDEIPADWRVPGTYTELRPDRRNRGLYPYPARTLIVAPRLAAGTGTTLRALRLTRVEDAVAWGGEGSIAAEMAEMFLANNATGDVSLFLLPDPAGVRATCTITLTGTPTAPGTLAVLIGGRRIAIPVNPAETVTVIATRLVTAITALVGRQAAPVTAANTAGVVTLTARHFGTVGNLIPVIVAPEAETPVPAGLTAVATAMTGGTLEADIAPMITAIATEWWTDLVFPSLTTAYVAALLPELERRWNAMVRLDANVWGMAVGTFSALSTLGNARNSRFITELGANASPSTPWAWAAALAGRATFFLLNDPARQLRGIPLVGILPPLSVNRFIDTERDLLLRDGISTWLATDDGQVVLERVITQNQRTTLGVEDTAWLDVMTVKTLSRIRYDWWAYMTATWPRAKLADDNAAAAEYDPEIATPRRLHNSWAARCTLYERLGWIQQAGQSAAESVFTRDVTDRNRVNARLRVRILGNLMTLAGVLEFRQ
jgi:phage tail sheath gpL-like